MAERFASWTIEQDEYSHLVIEPVPPRHRDWWRLLLGRYRPELRVFRRPTLKGYDRELKRAFIPGLREALNRPDLFAMPPMIVKEPPLDA